MYLPNLVAGKGLILIMKENAACLRVPVVFSIFSNDAADNNLLLYPAWLVEVSLVCSCKPQAPVPFLLAGYTFILNVTYYITGSGENSLDLLVFSVLPMMTDDMLPSTT